MPSLDVVSKINVAEVDNAVNGISREIKQRFDLKERMCSNELAEADTGATCAVPVSVIAYPTIPRSFAAVPPRILIRSSSLSPGIDMTWSTGAVFHGNG